MPWHPALNQLRDALAELYPDVADARLVATSALLAPSNIPLQGRARTVWQCILEEALKQDGVEVVISEAMREYGRNPSLLAAVKAYHQSLAEERPPTQTPALLTAYKAAPISELPAMPASVATPAADPLLLDLGGSIGLQLVRVPAGEFLMGSVDTDTEADDDEKPQHKLSLPEYLISKFPVTVAQYRAFAQVTHHQIHPPGFWQKLRRAYQVMYRIKRSRFRYSDTIGDNPDNPDNHPVTNVSWHEAVAFCEWATHASGRTVRLPSEAEWEKAARGTDGRIYPWGNRWDSGRCNCTETGPGSPTPVGHYSPKADSCYGCADMAGNVWTWTRSLEMSYPYDSRDGRENPDAGNGVRRVLRGGAYLNGPKYMRCTSRLWDYPHNLNDDVGFRVVVASSVEL